MQKQFPPPIKTPMYDSQGNMNHVWAKWFDEVGKYFDDYRRNPDRVFTATDGTLYTSDYGKTIFFNNGTTNVTCYLPTARRQDINCWLTIMRGGTGRLSIIPDAAARIEYSAYGGKIYCDETKRAAANLTLQLMTATQWAIIGATGRWKYV